MFFKNWQQLIINVPVKLKNIIDHHINNKVLFTYDCTNTHYCSLNQLVQQFFNIDMFDIVSSFVNFIHWNKHFKITQLIEIWKIIGMTPDIYQYFGDDNAKKHIINVKLSNIMKNTENNSDIHQEIYDKIYGIFEQTHEKPLKNSKIIIKLKNQITSQK